MAGPWGRLPEYPALGSTLHSEHHKEPSPPPRRYPDIVAGSPSTKRWSSLARALCLATLSAGLISLGACGGRAHLGTSSSTSRAPAPPNAYAPPGPRPPTTPDQHVAVPDVVGKNYEAAETEIAGTGTYGLVTKSVFVHDSAALGGTVVAQSPRAGVLAVEGAHVELTVSIGPATMPGSKACTAGELRAGKGPKVSEATGQNTLDLSLTNVSRSTCVLDGYPVVKLLGANGRSLAYRYLDGGDEMTTDAKPSPVYLPPGAKAWARINKYRCDIGSTAFAYAVVFTLPDKGGSVTMIMTTSPLYDYCHEAASLVVSVSPFEPVEAFLYPAWA